MIALDTKLKWSGWLIAIGLCVQAASSTIVHPLAFVAFLLLAVPLTGSGMLLFLWALATKP